MTLTDTYSDVGKALEALAGDVFLYPPYSVPAIPVQYEEGLKLLGAPEPSVEALRQIKGVVMNLRRYAETAGDAKLMDLLDKVDVSIQEDDEDGLGMYGAGVMW